MAQSEELIDMIRAEFLRRREVNPRYSMRSFASHLDISSGALSEILQGKRQVGLKLRDKIYDCLGASFKKDRQGSQNPKIHTLTEDQYKLIRDWYHFALQDLLRTKNCPRTPKELASRLDITTTEAVDALLRLQRLGMAREQSEKWYATNDQLVTTTHDIPSQALRHSFHQDLKNAARSLDEDDVHNRDFSSITLCLSSSRMKEAKEFLRDQRREFWSTFNEPEGEGDEVYQLTLCLFPLTKNNKGH